jgi:ABC-type transport system involved in multi-copper enzyme maturation permease subunit
VNEFTGVFQYEYRMSIRRWSLWLPFGILMALYLTSLLIPPDMADKVPTRNDVLPFAGTAAYMLNLFMPVVGGILAADRLVRDQKFGFDELIRSTALSRKSYLLGKYLGALFSIATPVLLTSLLLALYWAAKGADLSIIPAMLLSFLGINLPAYAFIVAFSLACPLFIPVRVYQVLFTGYWFWGNFLSPNVIPTLNGTFLTPSGHFVLYSFFKGFYGGGGPDYISLTSRMDAFINLAVLGACILLALVLMDRLLARQARFA